MDIQSTGNIATSITALTQKAPAPAEAAVAARATVESVEAATSIQQPVSVASLGQVAQALKSINKFLQDQGQNLEFTIDSDSNRTIVKVVDQDTKEILRQIPSEEALAISRALDQIKGLLVSEKA